jgi:hypothetical protein
MGQIITTYSHQIEYVKNIKNQSQTFSRTHIFGQYDFNRAPMAPPETRIKAHETPSRRRTWDPHGQDGWYIGPALEHYRCYTVYITIARGDRIVETVNFFPEKFTLPFPSSQDLATQAASDLAHALLHPQPAGPCCKVGDEQTIALKHLANIFEGAKQRKSKIIVTPTDGIENTAPGCKPQFHLRGWQAQTHNKCLPSQTHHHTQHQIHIADKKHLPDLQSHHKHRMSWYDAVLGSNIICPKI